MLNDPSNTVPDELILIILSFGDASDIASFQSTCKRYRNLKDIEDLWRKLCHRRWRRWPIYSMRIDTAREVGTDVQEQTWKERYKWVERDFLRTEITRDELERLEWHFNYLPWAGGTTGEAGTQSAAYFHQGRLYLLKYLWIYPMLTYELVEVNTQTDTQRAGNALRNAEFLTGMEVVLGEPLLQASIAADVSSPRSSNEQFVQIGSFPPHYVARTSAGGWILWNENVVLFSNGKPRALPLPDQLEMHIHMFRF